VLALALNMVLALLSTVTGVLTRNRSIVPKPVPPLTERRLMVASLLTINAVPVALKVVAPVKVLAVEPLCV
jgi:hypothetical protein